MLRRHVARVDELQHECDQVLVLDRRRATAGVDDERNALDLPRAREGEQRMQLRPFRRNPLLVAEQPDLGVETEVRDFAGDELRQQALPFVALRVARDLARERAIAHEEALRQVEQRLPELTFDA